MADTLLLPIGIVTKLYQVIILVLGARSRPHEAPFWVFMDQVWKID